MGTRNSFQVPMPCHRQATASWSHIFRTSGTQRKTVALLPMFRLEGSAGVPLILDRLRFATLAATLFAIGRIEVTRPSGHPSVRYPAAVPPPPVGRPIGTANSIKPCRFPWNGTSQRRFHSEALHNPTPCPAANVSLNGPPQRARNMCRCYAEQQLPELLGLPAVSIAAKATESQSPECDGPVAANRRFSRDRSSPF